MGTRYQMGSDKVSEATGVGAIRPVPEVGEALEDLVKRGAQEMLRRALEEEVETFLGRGRYDREEAFRGYRNGHAPERTVGSGLGAVAVRAPRVRDVPAEVAPDGYHSAILPRYQRRFRAGVPGAVGRGRPLVGEHDAATEGWLEAGVRTLAAAAVG